MPQYARVHIAPVGFDFRRVTSRLAEARADRVYLVTQEGEGGARTHFARIRKELAAKHGHVEVREVFLDMWDFYACVGEFRRIILGERPNHVYVNISSGTKITAAAGMLACMAWDAEPYYTRIEYSREAYRVLEEDVRETYEIPRYEIRVPRWEHRRILRLLEGRGGEMRKGEMMGRLVDCEIMREEGRDGRPLSGPARHSQLRALLDPLEKKWGFVRVSASGRRSVVRLTDQGRAALRVFGSDRADGERRVPPRGPRLRTGTPSKGTEENRVRRS